MVVTSSGGVTIYHVAERAGVSISTVSLAINHPNRVSERTRERVVEAAGELGYRPGSTPSERGKERTGRIAVIAPFTSYDSFRLQLVGVLDALSPHDVDVLVCDAPSAAEAPSPRLDTLPIRGDVDGAIVMGLPLSAEGADRLTRWGPPVVLVDAPHPNFSHVGFDDEHAGYLAASHLIDRGHRRIVYLCEPQRSKAYVSSVMLRGDGMRRAFNEAGGAANGYQLDEIVLAANDITLATEATTGLLTGGQRPSAIVAHHDALAAGVLAGARAMGVVVPEQLAVMGFDDGILAESLGMTTIRLSFEEAGRIGAGLLQSLMSNPGQSPTRTVLIPQLVIRSTT